MGQSVKAERREGETGVLERGRFILTNMIRIVGGFASFDASIIRASGLNVTILQG